MARYDVMFCSVVGIGLVVAGCGAFGDGCVTSWGLGAAAGAVAMRLSIA